MHSEVIQSRQWNLENEEVIKKQLDYEFVDTLVSMLIGWAINSSMIILAATTFFTSGVKVNELQQAQSMLGPLLGNHAGVGFCYCFTFAGVASSITSGMAGGSIFAGLFSEPFDVKDNHSRLGIFVIADYCTDSDLHYRKPFQSADHFSDDPEHSASLHYFSPDLPDFVAQSDGQICKFKIYHRTHAANWRHCNFSEYFAFYQFFLILLITLKMICL